jgi:nicotinate-nucleotide--dimethylbenzimidazole phosphoribosyltransferase
MLYCANGGHPVEIDPVRVFVAAADHGVTAEGVSAYPSEVTRQMVANILAGGAAVSVLCRQYGLSLRVVDAGCAGAPFAAHPLLIDRRIRSGSGNIASGPAMTSDEAVRALLAGIELASGAVGEGVKTLVIGEMGIGNTTPASALFCAMLGLAPETMTGPGTGLDASGVSRKRSVIGRALAHHADTVAAGDPLAILAALGGLEIAVMTGIVLGAALCRVPCVIDGFIAQSAWLMAVRICPAARGYTIVSHTSAEPGSSALWEVLGEYPLLSLGMRLGEGTGAALCIPLLRGAAALFNEMATFSSAGISGRSDR